MTTATWNTTNGNWFTAVNWDEPNPAPPPSLLHLVPGASDDVVIPDNAIGTPFTVTYNGTSTVNLLQGANPEDTLDLVGGSLTLANGGSQNSMSIDVDAGATLSVSAGTLVITNGDYAGTLAGNGAFSFVFGTFNLNAGFSITANTWVLGVTLNGTFSTTNLNNDLTYAHAFTLGDLSGNHAVLNLNGHTFTLSGTANFDGTIVGPGTVLVTGSAVHGTTGNGLPIIKGGATVEYANAATGTQHHNTILGDASTDGTLKIDAGATYTIDSSSFLGGSNGGHSLINNLGTLQATGAINASVDGQLTSTGTLSVGTGALLTLDTGTETLNGIISGLGTLSFGFAANATINTANVTVANMQLNGGNGGATLTFGTDLTYAGKLSFANQFDVIQLNAHTLILSGTQNSLLGNHVDGAGTLDVTGAATIGGNVSFGTSFGLGTAMTLENAGSIIQTGNVHLHGTLLNDLGHSYAISAAGSFDTVTSATITNNGTFADNAVGTSFVSTTVFTSTGVLSVASGATLVLNSGTETLGGTVSGAGTLVFGFASNATLNTTDVTVAEIQLNGGNGGATMTAGTDLTYAGKLSFANQFDVIALGGHTLTLSGTQVSLLGNHVNGSGTLKIAGAAEIGNNLSLGTSFGPSVAMTFENAGTVTQTNSISVNGTLLNDAGHTYTIGTAGNINPTGGGMTVTNNGTFLDNGVGTSNVFGNFSSNGAIGVGSGATLVLFGAGTLGGTISGAGELVLGSGATTTLNAPNISVANLTIATFAGATTLGADVAYTGNFQQGGSTTLDLHGHTLSLSGTVGLGGTLSGLNGALDRFVVTGTSTDLSAVPFANWEASDQIVLNGLGGADSLKGTSFSDTLNGAAGADVLKGLAGNDTYVIDNAGDIADESGGTGTDIDTVQSSIAFSLADTVHALGVIENLTLIGTANVAGTGNALANVITGNAGANLLSGADNNDILAGGAGNDTLNGGTGADLERGGVGNDVYLIDQSGDIATETGGSGVDTVQSRIAFSLADTLHVKGAIENLTLTGAAAIAGTGNALSNVITGNAGANLLKGGLGNDTVNGGSGNDNVNGDGGNDRVNGGLGNDRVNGGIGNDVVDGGAGKDVLTGGTGQDSFLFDTALNVSTNIDSITDFSVPNDTIRLENAIFKGLTHTGVLAAALFGTGTKSAAADNHLIYYNQTTGALYYDTNGAKAGGDVQFATLAHHLALTHSDFFVV